MAEQSKWVRHRTEQGPQWSPFESEEKQVTLAGPEPEMSAMESFDPVEYDQLDVLPPATPKRIVALAKNRPSEEKAPLVFLMTPSSVVGPGDAIRIPTDRGPTWSEVELAFVLDRVASDVSADKAREYIRGYTVANDVTTENVDGRDWHLPRGKALDTYCPTGPHLVTDLNTTDLAMTTTVNGELRQETTTSELYLGDADALELISSMITLEPGDMVLTGTPSSPLDATLEPGDETTVEIEGVGTLSNTVVER